MKFIVDGTKYEMDDSKLTFAEARAIEKVTGRTMAEIGKSGEDITTVQAMLWIAMRRDDKDLRFSDLDDLPVGAIEWLPEDEEQPEEPSDPTPLGGGPGEDSTPSG